MSVFWGVVLVIYCVVGFWVHIGMQKEYTDDVSGEMDSFNPIVVQMGLLFSAIIWPVLALISVYQAFKKGSK